MNLNDYSAFYRSKYPNASDDEIRAGYAELYGGNLGEALGTGLEVGGRQLAGSFASLGNMFGLGDGQFAEEQFRRASIAAAPYNEMGSLWDNPNLLLNPGYLAFQTGQVLPSAATTIIPGGLATKGASLLGAGAGAAAKIGAATSGLVGGAMEAGGDYYEYGDPSKALLFGGASALLNALPGGALFDKSKSALTRIGGSALMEGATEWAEEPTSALIHGEDVVEAMKEGVNVLPGSILSSLLLGGAHVGLDRYSRKAARNATPQEAMYSQVDAELSQEENRWHSPLMQAVSSQTMPQAPAEQWLNTLTREENGTRVPKLAGLSKEELDWYDIPSFLQSQKGPVSKQGIMDYIGAQEVGLETKQIAPDRVIADYYTPGGTNNVVNLINTTKRKGFEIQTPQMSRPFDNRADAVKMAADLRTEFPELADKIKVAPIEQKTGYKPHAFEEGDIWTRTSQRVNAEGKPVTLIEEVQSDLHQQGRKSQKEGEKLPKAPFSKSWAPVAVKSEIQRAIASGQDEIYITPGKMQQARYAEGQSEKLVDFYDKELVRELNKFLKKYNAKVDVALLPDAQVRQREDGKFVTSVNSKGGEAVFDTEQEARSFWRIKITPELKNAASLPLWSREERANGLRGESVDKLHAIYEKAFGSDYKKLVNAGRVKIVENTKALPGQHPPTVAGMYDPRTDTSYIVASNVTADTAVGKLLHEVGVHAGMEGMLGADMYNEVLAQLDAMRATNKTVQMAYEKATKLAARPEHVQHEALAYLVENHPQMSLVQKILAAIKQFLFRLGIKAKLSTGDIRQMAVAALRNYAQRPQAQVQAAPMYSQEPTPAPKQGENVGPYMNEFDKILKEQGVTAAVTWARRLKDTGVLPDVIVESLAKTIGMTTEQVKSRLPGTAYNAEESIAGIAKYKAWEESQIPTLKDLQKKLMDKTATSAEIAAALEIFAKAAEQDGLPLAAQVSAGSAESARALRILRKEQNPLSRMRALIDIIGNGDEALASVKLRAFVDAAVEGRGMSKIATDMMKITNMDKFAEYYKAMLLFNVPTQLVNAFSTLINTAVIQNLDQFFAAGWGKILGSKDAVTLGEVKARIAAQVFGQNMAAKAAADYFRTFESPERMTMFNELIDLPRRAIGVSPDSSKAAQVAGKVIRLPFRGLGSADAYFKHSVYVGSIAQQAYAKANGDTALAQKYMSDPTKDMTEQAIKDADRGTFNEKLGAVGSAVQNVIRKHKIIGTILFPFTTTPSNIVKEVFRHMPVLNMLMSDVRADLKKGGRSRDLAIARVTTGSAVMATAYALALAGQIVGQPPEDPNERRLWYAQGKKPNSIRIGDTWYSFSRIEPLGMLLGIAADAATFSKHSDIDSAGKLWSLVMSSITGNLTSKTYLRSLSELLNMIQEPERYGERYLQNFLGSLVVPTGVSHTARAFDDRLRVAEGIIDAIKMRVPLLRNTLTEKLDVFGKPITDTRTAGEELLSPFDRSPANTDKALSELRRLDISVPMPASKFRGVELTAAERNELIRKSNSQLYGVIQRIVLSPAYKKMPDAAKKYILESVTEKIRTQGRYAWSRQHPQILQEARQKQKQFTGVPDYE